MKITTIFDSEGNAIDQMEGHAPISGKMYEKHLPITVTYYTDSEITSVHHIEKPESTESNNI